MKTITIDFPGISLLEVRKQFPECFYTKKEAWYDDEDFAKEKIPAGKWEVDLEPIKNSFNKTWDEQSKFVKKSEVPPAAVLVYAFCKHFKDTDERAFETCYVRTSSRGAGGGRVGVGDSAGGLGVSDGWDYDRDSDLGVAGARKLDTGILEPLVLLEDLSLESRIKKLEAFEKQVRGFLILD